MPENMQNKDIRTFGFVLRRTNYGEADRILNIITPEGKISAIAKGVRKEKSKLAGGVEMFSLSEFNLHFGKSEFAVVTSAKMIKYYGNIVKDFSRLELAGMILKKTSLASESSDNEEYYDIVKQCLEGIDAGYSNEVVESWFLINLAKVMGEEINLYRNERGEKLSSEKKYNYDVYERAMIESINGEFGAYEIKFLRLIVSSSLMMVVRVKDIEMTLPKILRLARTISGAV